MHVCVCVCVWKKVEFGNFRMWLLVRDLVVNNFKYHCIQEK